MDAVQIFQIIYSAIGILGTGFTVAMFVVLKFNDLKHLSETVEEIKTKLDCIDKKMYNDAKKIGEIEGRCSANHPK